MKILVLGVGLQGRAALYDLTHSQGVEQIIAADGDRVALNQALGVLDSAKVSGVAVDASDHQRIASLMRASDAAIHLLPPQFRKSIARLAVENGCHFVDASYTHPSYRTLHDLAVANGVAILPEFGLDPGIDLVLAAEAVGSLDEVHELQTYGAGIPEPAAADNPLRYKISWSFAGVLRGYSRPARLLRDGQLVEILPEAIFAPDHGHNVEIDGLGVLEAYPNGDAVAYLHSLGIAETVRQAGRYSLRWPGHRAFWYLLSQLGFLSESPIPVGRGEVIPRQFLHDLLAPQLQYSDDERDVALVAVEVVGIRNHRPARLRLQVIDRRDLESGLLAMQRTVGFTASIGAQLVLQGHIAKRGLLSPISDVPSQRFFEELAKRGIEVERLETAG